MIYKQQFKSRVTQCKTTLAKIESACDDVKMSDKLKTVLHVVLEVGNQMNGGEKHAGYTLDSLLKLNATKANDKKTSILQYVIMVIQRSEESRSSLFFPDDLPNVSEASRLVLDSVSGESLLLRQGLDSACRVIKSIRDSEPKQAKATEKMATFLFKVKYVVT
jgi:hypothetical protein